MAFTRVSRMTAAATACLALALTMSACKDNASVVKGEEEVTDAPLVCTKNRYWSLIFVKAEKAGGDLLPLTVRFAGGACEREQKLGWGTLDTSAETKYAYVDDGKGAFEPSAKNRWVFMADKDRNVYLVHEGDGTRKRVAKIMVARDGVRMLPDASLIGAAVYVKKDSGYSLFKSDPDAKLPHDKRFIRAVLAD